jgi:hypothetical protein
MKLYKFSKVLFVYSVIRTRLRKSLYGLKQSPRVWFDRFKRVMVSMGYQ